MRNLALAPFHNIYPGNFVGYRENEPLSPAPDPGPVCWASSWKSKQGPRSHTPILINLFIHLFNKYLVSFYQVRNLSPRRKTELYEVCVFSSNQIQPNP